MAKAPSSITINAHFYHPLFSFFLGASKGSSLPVDSTNKEYTTTRYSSSCQVKICNCCKGRWHTPQSRPSQQRKSRPSASRHALSIPALENNNASSNTRRPLPCPTLPQH